MRLRPEFVILAAMITLRRVSEPTSLPCPTCDEPLLAIEPSRHRLFGKPLDGDIIDMHTLLDPERCVPTGFQCLIDWGTAKCCETKFVMIGAIFVNKHLEPQTHQSHSDFVGTYFFFNGDRGPGTNFIASRGKQEWLMERFDSEFGPVQQHHLGPLPSKWEGDRRYAEDILIAMWDDLRALSAASS